MTNSKGIESERDNQSPAEAELKQGIETFLKLYRVGKFVELTEYGMSALKEDLQTLFTHYSKQQVLEARISELEKWQQQWFALATTVPRMQASPKPLKEYVRDRVAELRNLLAQEGGEG